MHEAHTRGSFGSVCKVYERTQSTSLRLYLLDSFSYLSIYLSIFLTRRLVVSRYPPFSTSACIRNAARPEK